MSVGRLPSPVKTEHPRIPTSTYRLQFNRWFTFTGAREIVAYLDALGVSDVYASPYFQASPESLHGYDIADHNKLNEAIGSLADYDAWVAQLQAHGMGQVLDFVPNHVGIANDRNAWWMDVLENGPSSTYSSYFDIDWQSLKTDLRNKVLLPILGDQYGRVLERGELQVRFEEGTFHVLYGERRLPIAPGTYRYILEVALKNLAEYKDDVFYAELQSILTALEYLPKRTEIDPKRIAERAREKEIIKRRLERRCAQAPQVQHAIEKALAQINGNPGDPHSFDKLDELLNAQSYRLAFWRVAAEEINYRRFFDVNDLAAIRVELPKVFDTIHRLVLELMTKGAVTAIEEISTIINQINDISNSIASAVEQQTATTNEIGRSVNEAAQGVNDIAKNIGGVATAAKNTTQGANDTKKASLQLSEMATRLQAAVAKFTF